MQKTKMTLEQLSQREASIKSSMSQAGHPRFGEALASHSDITADKAGVMAVALMAGKTDQYDCTEILRSEWRQYSSCQDLTMTDFVKRRCRDEGIHYFEQTISKEDEEIEMRDAFAREHRNAVASGMSMNSTEKQYVASRCTDVGITA